MKFSYLNLIEEKGLRPNFWCSEEYFEKACFVERKVEMGNNFYYVEIRDCKENLVFPPLSNFDDGFYPFYEPVLMDMFGYKYNYNSLKNEFFDFEYIFRPKDFINMVGKKWTKFRKNCKKFPKRFDGRLFYISKKTVEKIVPNFEENFDDFVGRWVESIKWEEIHDADIMLKYVYGGNKRDILVDENGNILAMNIWDENYIMINFRYCICLDKPFLNEYMRYMFYFMNRNSFKLVNDGGVLDNDGIKEFKDKMNPYEVNKINSWKHYTKGA